MKKVLVIGHLLPSIGSFRLVPLVKYLPEFEWQPTVLTGPADRNLDWQFGVVETPYHDALDFWKRLFRLNPDENIPSQVRKRFHVTANKKSFVDFFLHLGGEISTYPDLYRGWKPFAIKAGNDFLQHENIDAMISGYPITGFIVASKLKEQHNIPWIVDFTDLWTQNHNYKYGPLRKLLDKRLEVKTLSKADALVTISQHWAEKLTALHKEKPVYVITHGFDPAEVNLPPAELTSKFTITYTGTIYTGKQDPARLFAALRDLISNGTMNPNDIEVRFYGPEIGWLTKEIERYGLSNIIKHYERVPKEIALQKQRESQLLLLLDWDDIKEKGVYTSKIFEYLGARRPILATGGSTGDVVEELLSETKAGRHAPTGEDIKDALNELYQEYKLKGEVAYKGEESKVSKYSHREMARKFAEILDQLTSVES